MIPFGLLGLQMFEAGHRNIKVFVHGGI